MPDPVVAQQSVYRPDDLIAPCNRGAEVTPSNDDDLAFHASALLADTDCAVKITTSGGDELVINLQAGVPFSMFRVSRVWATGGDDLTGIAIIAGWQERGAPG